MKKHRPQRAALIIGTGEFVNELLEEIARHPEFGYHIIGLVAWDNQVADNSCVPPLLGSLENINRIIQKKHLRSSSLHCRTTAKEFRIISYWKPGSAGK